MEEWSKLEGRKDSHASVASDFESTAGSSSNQRSWAELFGVEHKAKDDAEANAAALPVDDARFSLAVGCPFQRLPVERSHESRQQRLEAGERMLRLATEYREKLEAEKSRAASQRRSRCSKTLPPMKFQPPEQAEYQALADGAKAKENLEGTVIIFDWDDTLFPTWFIMEVLLPCLPNISKMDETVCKAAKASLSDSAFTAVLTEHTKTMVSLLHAARAIGRVGIVTLSRRPWVNTSAEQYLLGVDFSALLEELEIPVIYARETVKRSMFNQAQMEEGVDPFTVVKQAAMAKVLKKLYGKNPWKNIISIGDSCIERDAIKEVLWNHEPADGSGHQARCKTVKLMEEPSVEQLSAELLILQTWLRQMAKQTEDFDITLDGSDGMVAKMNEKFPM
eukprot:gnl/TRDRNA2_/TRDRNA2_29779_c0_seq1.p1 gnl/TRDRNA2_/TRDRNA2_29779_c0~~gnl/TRDRNA2_/TRDRNA2_29779_c0_seq1.p1  ORF type:complete len:393 (+),score=103.44 gnl/TRDRNA2_/TRDRNA2_29779_c0_seq1:167-1345(+)